MLHLQLGERRYTSNGYRYFSLLISVVKRRKKKMNHFERKRKNINF